MKKKLMFTVAIPTCYGGGSLVAAIASIRASQEVTDFPIIVVADSIPIPTSIKKELKALGVQLTENKGRGTQMKKVKQMIAKCKTDVFIFTQDDIRFDQNALSEIMSAFERDPKLTMLGVNIQPEPARTFFERVIEVGLKGAYRVGTAWRGGDNYLLANGRCMAFRTSFLKKFTIPDAVVNADAYLYFENKRRGGTFSFAKGAIVYNRSPQQISEHIRQSNRFAYSATELQRYFGPDIVSEYELPRQLVLQSLFAEFLSQPLFFSGYLAVQIVAKLNTPFNQDAKTPLWKVNLSTKSPIIRS